LRKKRKKLTPICPAAQALRNASFNFTLPRIVGIVGVLGVVGAIGTIGTVGIVASVGSSLHGGLFL
jgi:hypothetical protein